MKFHATCAAALLTRVSAWWDEGHMLVAAVARKLLSEEQVEAIERPLKHWSLEYEGSDNMVAAAVWPDHIKCFKSSYICEGFERLDALTIFDTWHYTTIPYNPSNLILAAPFHTLPWPGVGASFALRQLVTGPWKLQHWNDVNAEDVLMAHPRRHHHNASPQDESPALSAFSWNTRLRFIIHIMGDLHQPLHATETFTREFPTGDKGGNLWRVRTTQGKVMSLHSYWDSCADQFRQDWPDMSLRDVQALAVELLRAYPPESISPERLQLTSFDGIANDSYKVAVNDVFKFITDWNATQEPTYNLTENYEHQARAVCQQQIVLAGYRLTHLLLQLYHVALKEWQPPMLQPSGPLLSRHTHSMVAILCGGGLGATVAIAALRSLERLRRLRVQQSSSDLSGRLID